jgi:type IV pilus assembly protein PilA
MVIVGLLAAITVPQISKWREKAYITSMKTDARNVASAIEASYVDNQTYPATTSAVVGNTTADLVTKLDVKLSGGNTLTSYTGTGNTAFSFVITSDKVSTASQDVATYTSNPAPGVANLAFS